jgi:hypothetical protein
MVCACARTASVWMLVFGWVVAKTFCFGGVVSRVKRFANSQVNSRLPYRNARTMECIFVTFMNLRLMTNGNAYVKCVYVCWVFRRKSYADKIPVFWIVKRGSCVALLTLRRSFLPTAIRMSRRNKLVYPCRVEGWLNVCGKFFLPVSFLYLVRYGENGFVICRDIDFWFLFASSPVSKSVDS